MAKCEFSRYVSTEAWRPLGSVGKYSSVLGVGARQNWPLNIQGKKFSTD